MTEPSNSVKRFSFFFLAVISILLVLSFISLSMAVETYRRTGSPDLLTVTLSVSAIALSSYMLLQTRRKPLKLGFEMSKVFTTVQCSSCDFKNVRDFQNGDYILKDADPCPKCDSPSFISTIYRKAEEKAE